MRKQEKTSGKVPGTFFETDVSGNAKNATRSVSRLVIDLCAAYAHALLEKEGEKKRRKHAHTLPHGLTVDGSIRKPFLMR